MPRISTVDINTVEYWTGIYRDGLFPTLDLGCGQGGVGRALGSNVAYTGVDWALDAILTKVNPRGHYLCQNWRDVNIRADTVYCLELIEHVDDPSELLAHAASLSNKRLVIGTPRFGLIPYPLHRGEHQWDFTTEELIALLSPYGTVGEIIPAGRECCIVAVTL